MGWYARVRFRGRTHSKYFADASHLGTLKAFAKALAWRNEKERQVGKPRTDRVVPAGLKRKSSRVAGVYQSKQSYVVAWSPSPGVVRREFVSITMYGREEALRRAVELRQRRERTIYGRVISETSTAPAKGKRRKR